jgi:thiol-disulfide isomerase/thioredoxin
MSRPIKLTELEDIDDIESDLHNLVEEGKIKTDLVVIVYNSQSCSPCVKLKQAIYNNGEGMSKENSLCNIYGHKVAFVYIDFDDNSEVCQELKIKSLPTIHIGKLNKNGFKKIDEITGFNIPKLKRSIESNL